MRIAILETGAPPEPLDAQYGRYGAMFEAMFDGAGAPIMADTLSVFEGAAPPDPSAYDGYLITGSPAGAYESHEWIPPLERFIREAAALGKPTVGICFGHQVMAQAFGGAVEKSEKGWGAGVHVYEVLDTPEWMNGAPERFACAVSHQDQVVRPPEGARRIAGSNFCLFGALEYAQGPAVSFQMHPEFEHAFAADLLSMREDRIPGDVARLAHETLKRGSDRDAMARWIATFLSDAR